MFLTVANDFPAAYSWRFTLEAADALDLLCQDYSMIDAKWVWPVVLIRACLFYV